MNASTFTVACNGLYKNESTVNVFGVGFARNASTDNVEYPVSVR